MTEERHGVSGGLSDPSTPAVQASPGTGEPGDVLPELTDEQRADICSHNAFVRALDAVLTDVRQRSYEGKLTKSSRWKKRSFAPQGMGAAQFEEAALMYIEQHEHAQDVPTMGDVAAPAPLEVQLAGKELQEGERLPDPDLGDIALIYGKKGIYLYSVALMSHSFAHALFNTSEQSDVATFVDVVRSESRVYPRPVAANTFMNVPYLWSVKKTMQVFDLVRESGSFEDIKMVRTSLNEPFFYSTWYLSDAQGAALAEWYGVEKGINP